MTCATPAPRSASRSAPTPRPSRNGSAQQHITVTLDRYGLLPQARRDADRRLDALYQRQPATTAPVDALTDKTTLRLASETSTSPWPPWSTRRCPGPNHPKSSTTTRTSTSTKSARPSTEQPKGRAPLRPNGRTGMTSQRPSRDIACSRVPRRPSACQPDLAGFSRSAVRSAVGQAGPQGPDLRELVGDDGNRTDDPLLAKQVLYQLSYVPGGDDRRLPSDRGAYRPADRRPSSESRPSPTAEPGELA